MKARAFFAFTLLVLLPAALPARTQTDAQQLAAVVGTLLAQAPQSFTGMRLSRIDSDADFTSYKVKPFGTHCRACTLYDEYARGAYKEYWYIFDRWNLPSKLSPAKSEAYAVRALAKTVSGFTLHRTVSKYSKYPTLLWHGPNDVWVSVTTNDDGYGLQVGHDLVTPVHVLRPPTSAQIKHLIDATTNFIRLGEPAASGNFETLRTGTGARDELGDQDYGVNSTFGPMLRGCRISNVANSFGYKDFQPKWVLSCDVTAMAGTADALKPVLHDAVQDALPDGFTATTDSRVLVLDDYRWDDTDVSVDISSFENHGVVHFMLAIYHYLPKPSDSGT